MPSQSKATIPQLTNNDHLHYPRGELDRNYDMLTNVQSDRDQNEFTMIKNNVEKERTKVKTPSMTIKGANMKNRFSDPMF